MLEVKTVEFNKDTPNNLKEYDNLDNWPVVYIINNKDEAYIGETVNVAIRSGQHFRNEERKRLKSINIISDNNFNKSVVLDLESFLINHMAADGKYALQNSNMGTRPHRYYQQEEYEKAFTKIWGELRKRNLVKNSIHYIQNSDLFKYSPYKALSLDQYRVVDSIIQTLVDNQNGGDHSTIFVKGGAGSGKTVLAIYLMKLLSEIGIDAIEVDYEMDPGYVQIAENLSKLSKMKIGLVIPMQSLRSTVGKVFKSIKHLGKKMILSPIEVPKEQYDLLIIDEAHRLRQRNALSQYSPFDKNNRKLGLDNSGTELDWIFKCSKNQVFFYDDMQSIKPSDIDKNKFVELQNCPNVKTLALYSQFRCLGGTGYVQYVKDILSDKPPTEIQSFKDYDFKLFSDIAEMVEAIKVKEQKLGLCRMVAGYSWKWASKKDIMQDDITIDGHSYKWNTTSKDWVNSPNAINEIGCIHTVQGYDLNYAGVIFGNEIKYDSENKKIFVDKKHYHDLPGKTALRDEYALTEYIENIYKVLLTRGIAGTYVYVCDDDLRKYLSRYICSC